MRKRVRKSIKASWRLPETLFSSIPLVWSSRFLLIFSFTGILLSTYFTTLLFFSTLVALVASCAVFSVLLLVLVSTFASDYRKVYLLERLEARILQYFPGYPEFTDIHLIEEDTDVWMAYGHVPADKLTEDICKIMVGLSGGSLNPDKCRKNQDKVEYLYAKFDTSDPSMLKIRLCGGTASGRFPVTRLDNS